jgi:hypothetical protein
MTNAESMRRLLYFLAAIAAIVAVIAVIVDFDGAARVYWGAIGVSLALAWSTHVIT